MIILNKNPCNPILEFYNLKNAINTNCWEIPNSSQGDKNVKSNDNQKESNTG